MDTIALFELLEFLKQKEIDTLEIIWAKILKIVDKDTENKIILKIHYTDNDFVDFMYQLSVLKYENTQTLTFENTGTKQQLYGIIGLTKNRWMERYVDQFGERWVLKTIPTIPSECLVSIN